MNPCSVSLTRMKVTLQVIFIWFVTMTLCITSPCFFILRYLHVVHEEAAGLSLPVQVVFRLAAERQRAGLCGAICDLSITQTTARYEQRGGVEKHGMSWSGWCRHDDGLAVVRFRTAVKLQLRPCLYRVKWYVYGYNYLRQAGYDLHAFVFVCLLAA